MDVQGSLTPESYTWYMGEGGRLVDSDEASYEDIMASLYGCVPAGSSVTTLPPCSSDDPADWVDWPFNGAGRASAGRTFAQAYVLAGDSMTWKAYMANLGGVGTARLQYYDANHPDLILSNVYSPMGSLGNTPLGMGIEQRGNTGGYGLAPDNPHFTTVEWQNRTPDDRYTDVTDEQTCGQIYMPEIDDSLGLPGIPFYPNSPYPLDSPYLANDYGTDGSVFHGSCWGALLMTVTMADMKPFHPVGTALDGLVENPGIRIGTHWGYDPTGNVMIMPPLAVQPYCDGGTGPYCDGGITYDILTNPNSDFESGFAYISVLDPHLQVVKEVCTKYSEAGEPLCTNDDPDGWEPDTDGPGDVSGPAGVTAGVTAGVEQGSLPAGVTQLLWRITAVNSGNMPLTGVHVAADEMTFQPAAGSAAVQASQDDCSGMEFHDTYAAPGQPTTALYHDIRGQASAGISDPAAGLLQYDTAAAGLMAYGSLMPGASMSQTCTTSLSAPFTGTVQNSVGLNAFFDDPDDPIFWQPDALLYNTGGYAYANTSQSTNNHIYSESLSSYAVDTAKTIMSRFTGFGGAAGQLASNVDSAQVVIPSSPVNNPPQTPPASSQPPALPPSDQAPTGGRVQPASGLLGPASLVGAGLLAAGVLVYRRQRPLFHTRLGSRAG